MFKRVFAAALLFGMVGQAPPALAKPVPCGTHESFADQLKTRYHEAFTAGGLQAGNLFEIWSSAESGSWTVLLTRPDGVTCAVASGTDWFDAPVGKLVEGTPS